MSYDEASDFADKRKYVSDLTDILGLYELELPSGPALEIGGEGGMLAGLLAKRLAHVIVTDIVNAQIRYSGQMSALLTEKFARNDEEFRLEKIEFLAADAQNLPFRDNWFDFCYSQNAFEHIPDPEQALREAVRVTRPGGLIYLMFDPVWTADSGSHFLHRIGEPWLHLLEDDDEIADRMRAGGSSDEEVNSYRHHMNRRPINYYLEMFPRVLEEIGAELILKHQWQGVSDEAYANHPNLNRAADKLALSPDDLLVRGLRYLIRVN